jgi:hypothetical protein
VGVVLFSLPDNGGGIRSDGPLDWSNATNGRWPQEERQIAHLRALRDNRLTPVFVASAKRLLQAISPTISHMAGVTAKSLRIFGL